MAKKDDGPSAGDLFIEAISWVLAGLVSMVLCVFVALYEFGKWFFKWLFRTSG